MGSQNVVALITKSTHFVMITTGSKRKEKPSFQHISNKFELQWNLVYTEKQLVDVLLQESEEIIEERGIRSGMKLKRK